MRNLSPAVTAAITGPTSRPAYFVEIDFGTGASSPVSAPPSPPLPPSSSEVTLVNKTVFTNGGLAAGSFSLIAPSTPGNWLVCVVFMDGPLTIGFGAQIVLETDQGESPVIPVGGGGFGPSNSNGSSYEGFYLLSPTTKVCNSISFSQVPGITGGARVPSIVVYEISGLNLAITDTSYAGANAAYAAVSSWAGQPVSSIGENETIYIAAIGTNNAEVGNGRITGVGPPWTVDIINAGSGVPNVDNPTASGAIAAGSAYLISTGTQQAIFSLSPADWADSYTLAISSVATAGSSGGSGPGPTTPTCGPVGETVWLWSGLGKNVPAGPAWDPASNFPYGQGFTGLGWLGRIENVPQTTDAAAENITLMLSGIVEELLGDAINAVRLSGSVTVWLAFLDDNNNVIADPLQIWQGETDVPSIVDGAETCDLSITVENALIALNLASNRRFTTLDQQLDFPGDAGFDFITAMQDLYLAYPDGVINTGGNIDPAHLGNAPSSSNALTIAPAGPQKLSIGGTLAVAASAQFVTGPFSHAGGGAGTYNVTAVGLWSSSDPMVAIVSNGAGANITPGHSNFGSGGGVITAVGKGNCTITFFFGSVSCSLTVSVA